MEMYDEYRLKTTPNYWNYIPLLTFICKKSSSYIICRLIAHLEYFFFLQIMYL